MIRFTVALPVMWDILLVYVICITLVERCMTVNVATNILQCKTEEQWTSVGNTQCKLTSFQGQKTVLVNSRVRGWVCDSIHFHFDI